jgi:nucleotide-binding universal stress UspA family protein
LISSIQTVWSPEIDEFKIIAVYHDKDYLPPLNNGIVDCVKMPRKGVIIWWAIDTGPARRSLLTPEKSLRSDEMYQKILVPLDGSELAECALTHVESIAKGCQVVDVVLLGVIEPLHLPGDYVISEKDKARIESQRRGAAEDYLGRMAEQLSGRGLGVSSEVIAGKVADSIVDYANKHGVDLIIMATHGRSGVSRWTLGSVADRVVHHSGVPVLLVRAPGAAQVV